MSAAPIHLLPPAVADAIAAGEVVERPASVVKELCENALDAGARRVEVSVEGGGIVRIRVTDDGAGIGARDLTLAVARHATSKIEAAADLVGVRTLGFRGEALASIAAVADVTITSCTGDAPAEHLRVRASQVLEQGAAAAARGTSVEVRDLFFNTPARLRFLRQDRSETAAAVRVVADLALSHPEVAFTCRTDGRTALRSPGGSLRDALRAVFGPVSAATLLDVTGDGEVRVAGAISAPVAHRAARTGLVLVVNRRRVHNRSLVAAVEEAYRGLLPGGRHPFGCVVVDLDPAGVDVNVHPTKREVRFRDERRVFAAVQRACWEALREAMPATVRLGAALDGGAAPGTLALGEPAAAGGWRSSRWRTPGGSGDAWALWESLRRERADAGREGASVGAPGEVGLGDGGAALGDPDDAAAPGDDAAGADSALVAGGIGALRPLRAVGQVGAGWMVAESPRGVVLVDPHAAHEKVLYTEVLAAWGEAGGAAGRRDAAGRSQLLLMPALLECDADRVARLEEHADFVRRCGFELEPFGPATVRCSAVPAGCRGGDDLSALVHELLDSLDAADRPASERQHRVAALVACHSAVRLGDALAPDEQQRLLDRLTATAGGITCPHGRPTVLVLDDAGLRRAFRRPSR